MNAVGVAPPCLPRSDGATTGGLPLQDFTEIMASPLRYWRRRPYGNYVYLIGLDITSYQLPITNYPLPITHYQLPITYSS